MENGEESWEAHKGRVFTLMVNDDSWEKGRWEVGEERNDESHQK